MAMRFKGKRKFFGLAKDFLRGQRPAGSHTILKTGVRTVYRVPQKRGAPLFVKVMPTKKGLIKNISYVFRQSYAFDEYAKIKRVRRHGVKTPELLAAGEESGKAGRFGKSVLITRGVKGQSLIERIAAAGNAEKRMLIIAFADFVRDLHAKNILHKDLKLNHVFVQKTSRGLEFSLIDLASVKFKKIKTKDIVSEFKRIESKLLRWEDQEKITATDRLRFWKRYYQTSGKLTEEEKTIIRQIMKKAREREHLRKVMFKKKKAHGEI